MNRLQQALCVGGLLLLAVCGVGMVWRQLTSSWPAHSKNGYRNFLQAAALLPQEAADYSGQAALAGFVSRSAPAYAQVQLGLKETCFVPLKPSRPWEVQHSRQEVPALKALTHALIAKAKLAELQGQTEAAWEGYTTAYRFAAAIGHGGLALDFLNSISCKAVVIQHCQSLLPTLAPEEKVHLLRLIEAVEAEQERPAVVARRTHRWQRVTLGFRAQLQRWNSLLREAWRTRSWAPFSRLRTKLTQTALLYEEQWTKPLCRELAKALEPNRSPRNPGGSAHRGEITGSETNSISPATRVSSP